MGPIDRDQNHIFLIHLTFYIFFSNLTKKYGMEIITFLRSRTFHNKDNFRNLIFIIIREI